jgi:two-component system, NarL family, response regulator NreC
MSKKRVLLADDHQIVRDGLRALIEQRSDMEVVAEAETGRSAVQLARKHLPDVVVMDITMPDLNGIDATRQILEEVPQARVIALSMHSDRHYVDGMLRAGVTGYLLKDCASEELIECILAVSSGKIYLSPAVTPLLVKELIRPTRGDVLAANAELSARERGVLQMIAEGRSTREIADSLCISVKTVETHRKKIMEKSNLHTVADLTKYAIRLGLTSVDS